MSTHSIRWCSAAAALATASVLVASCSSKPNTNHGAAAAAGGEASAASPVGPQSSLPFHWNREVTWLAYEEALAQAARNDRPVMVLAYATWCGRSSEFVSEDLHEPSIADAMKERFVVARVDLDADAGLLKSVAPEVQHVPSVWFTDASGKRLEVFSSDGDEAPFSYDDPDDLVRAMNEALEQVGKEPLQQPVAAASRGDVREMDQAELDRRKPLMEPLVEALRGACGTRPEDEALEEACAAAMLSMMAVRSVSDTAEQDYSRVVQTCASEGDCLKASLLTFWGAPPLTEPDPARARDLAKTGCEKQDEASCALSTLYDQLGLN